MHVCPQANRRDIAPAYATAHNKVQANDYLFKSSLVGLIFSFVVLVNYVSKSFAKLDTANNIFLKSTLLEIDAGESVYTMNTRAQSFLCEELTTNITLINIELYRGLRARTVCVQKDTFEKITF